MGDYLFSHPEVNDFFTSLRVLAVELLVRVGLATVLGVAIGFERQWRSRVAGL